MPQIYKVRTAIKWTCGVENGCHTGPFGGRCCHVVLINAHFWSIIASLFSQNLVLHANLNGRVCECLLLEKWFPLQGERGHSSYFRCFQKQNREEGETE